MMSVSQQSLRCRKCRAMPAQAGSGIVAESLAVRAGITENLVCLVIDCEK